MRSNTRRAAFAALLTSTTALAAAPALAQDAEEDGYDTEIIVTAQKRSESLQNVPISIQALGTEKLQDLNITDFKSYSQQLPSISAQSGGTPGTYVIYMRGVASGGDGNHSGSLPSVGVYLDEQPVTTIGGNLDVHIYDIARIESLAGPQGTLYGASSEAGTIRIITNKPDTSGFYGRADGEINTVNKGGIGGKGEAMINAPLSSMAALRVVGFYQRDAGYIDNVPGTRCFLPQPGGICVNNAAYVEKDSNDTDTYGGRAALQIDLDDTWTVTPTVMYQETKSHGSYGYDESLGILGVQRFAPEFRNDKFVQAALTIEGKLGNWDVTYAGAYLDRKTYSESDYIDYAESYDQMYSAYVSDSGFTCSGISECFAFTAVNGNQISPAQRVIGTDHFKKMSHELRVASPSEDPFRVVAGLFYQRQSNDIHQDYQVTDLAPLLSVNGFPGTLWLTQQKRIDRDYAMFGEMSFDITPQVTFTAGGRAFIYDNSLIGFFGFGRNPAYVQGASGNPPPNAVFSSRTGVAGCFTTTGERLRDAQLGGNPSPTLLPANVPGSPCTNLGVYANGEVRPVTARGSGGTYRFNLTIKPTDKLMVYGTVSRGFRPGGINRRADVPAYQPDYLTNYELGWKATIMPGFRINGAVYRQDWKKFQFSYLGANSFTEIHNGPDARIWGAEIDAALNSGPFSLSASAAWTDAKTTKNLCSVDDPTFECTGFDDNGRPNLIVAESGTRLPITPRWKLAGTARYTTEMGSAKVYSQVNASYQSRITADLRKLSYMTYPPTQGYNPSDAIGRLKEFFTVNAAVGAEWDRFSIEAFIQNITDERGQLSRYQQCGSCSQRTYVVPITPRTIGLRVGVEF